MSDSEMLFKQHDIIAQGGTSKVYRGFVNGQEQAIKVFLENVQQKNIQKEISAFDNIRHENILKRLSYDPSENPRWLGTELCLRYDLMEILIRTGSFPQNYGRYLSKKVSNAVKYLHDNGLAHRDVKPENIFFDCDCVPKLGDFGYITSFLNDEEVSRKQGTRGYLAPELQIGEKKIHASELSSTDMFSLGVTIFIVVCGYFPFNKDLIIDNTDFHLLRLNKWDVFWRRKPSKQLENSFKEMIQGLFAFNPSERWNIQQLLQCEWMKGETCSDQEFQTLIEQRIQKITSYYNQFD